MTSASTASRDDVTTGRSQIRTIVASSVVGTTVEWFDFFAYSTAAALILNSLFFPDYDPLVGTILAFGGIAVGYFGRPLGSIVFGHFGDRIGRKRMLVISLVLMGVATFLIGLLPTYAAIGVAAPILLMVLRFVQGFALGGEWGGAVLLVVEHAEPRKRAFLGSFPQVGLALGLTLSTLVFLPLVALPGDAFQTWGWRVPFLVSAVLVLVGLFIRLKITETPEFEKMRDAGKAARVPLWETLKTHPGQVILAALSFAVIARTEGRFPADAPAKREISCAARALLRVRSCAARALLRVRSCAARALLRLRGRATRPATLAERRPYEPRVTQSDAGCRPVYRKLPPRKPRG